MKSSLDPSNPPYLTLTISQALSLPTPTSPEPTQHESVNHMLDARALHAPHQLAVGFTHQTPDHNWQCQTLTYAQSRTLSLLLAGKLRDRLPERQTNAKSPNRTPLVAILSPSGVDLFGHILALWRSGYGVLCIAPGSPAESIANLLRLTETKVVLAHNSQTGAARAAVEALRGESKENSIKAQVCEMLPNVLDLLHGNTSDTAEIQESVARGDDVLVTMHTSGSSGLPKPIYQLHRFWTTSMLTAPGRELSAFTTTPLFHGGMSDLLRSIQAGSSIFFHPTADPGALSTSAICQAITACKQTISYFLSVPYILIMLFSDRAEQGRNMLKGMQLVSTGGAPLPQQLGDDMVQNNIRLVSRLGSSECGFLMSSWRDFITDVEWNYLRIPDELGQAMIRFEPHDGRLFELVVAKDWPTKLVANREDGGYATSDLYSKHETLPNTWRYDSRSDDTLVLVSGKKASSTLAESKLKASPLVGEAIVFGANRAILGALVFVNSEAAPDDDSFDDKLKVKLLQQLQPILAQINESSPPHAQLASEMIHLLPPSCLPTIPRASKGTLQRGRAYQQFSTLINQIYLDFEEGRSLRINRDQRGKVALQGTELISWLQGEVERINGTRLEPDTDVFVAGVDSIQSARIRAAIHQGVELDGRLLDRNVVYEYPTLRLLAHHIEAVRAGSVSSDAAGEKQERELQLMRELVTKYSPSSDRSSDDFKATQNGVERNQISKVEEGGTLFLLTGVTGGLGAQLLNRVAAQLEPNDTILCLVRARDTSHARQRVLEALQFRHLDSASTLLSSGQNRPSIHCLASDLSQPNCGIHSTTLSKLGQDHTRVVTIHSAWSVNFVASLSSFEGENIVGLSHVLDLHKKLVSGSLGCWQLSCFTFCSSVASILSTTSCLNSGRVLGETLSNETLDAVPMGYARSKWVAEQLVASHFHVQSSRYAIVRIGQLCSETTHGVWNESEAWPILIHLSQQVGCFPNLQHERLDWVATDIAAQTLLDLSNPTSSKGMKGDTVEVYNLAQPTKLSTDNRAMWKDLYHWLTASGIQLNLIDPSKWLEKIQKADLDHRGLLSLWQKNFIPDSHKQPAGQETRYNCDKALNASPAFRNWHGKGVTQDLIEKTVQRWKDIGFLN
ncbi:related to LYS2 - L-aminoadipate-semialdehyde dehydrogenase, large subunit [Ustilago trichophora]|uniref:Related to LYS2 - L-aminoadipate-semialdehyde dehydrogenase, large subunit n=1 Tax=Ustilago trichophora TaxID=86804 RepID=A0A5C3E5P1_9BASI|nr:related to LYS2 - L-aminoadipate-semialdehyde dehydrogenase, large subunit [Ustilago trichophora]